MSNTFTEPTWSSIRAAGEEVRSRFETLPGTPFEMTGVFVRLLQFHFSDEDRISNTRLKGYIWDSDESSSKILIEPGFMQDFSKNLQKPALFVERAEIKPVNIPTPLKDLNITISTSVNGGGTSLLTQNEKRFKFIAGAHTIVCEGIVGAEAELLAEEVFERFLYFAPVIEDDYNLKSFEFAGMSGLQKRDDRSTPSYFVGVSFSWNVMYEWQTVTENPV